HLDRNSPFFLISYQSSNIAIGIIDDVAFIKEVIGRPCRVANVFLLVGGLRQSFWGIIAIVVSFFRCCAMMPPLVCRDHPIIAYRISSAASKKPKPSSNEVLSPIGGTTSIIVSKGLGADVLAAKWY